MQLLQHSKSIYFLIIFYLKYFFFKERRSKSSTPAQRFKAMELWAPLTQERRSYALLFGCLVALRIVLGSAHTFYSNDVNPARIVGRETLMPKGVSLPLSSASPSIQQTTTETNSSTYNQKCDMKKTKWFIFSEQRSGTHWLMGLLASYGFRTVGELFMNCPKMRNATNHRLRQAQSLNGFILQVRST